MLFTAISILINNNEEIFVLYQMNSRICIINYCKFSQRGYSAATIWNCKLPEKILDLRFNYLEAQETGQNNQWKNVFFSYYVDQMPITIYA